MSGVKLDPWDWLALILLFLCVVYFGALIALLHLWRDAFDLVQAWVEGLALSPNRLLPFAYAPPESAPSGYLVTRQINLMLVPLVVYYLLFRIRADFLGREAIGGLDLIFGIVSLALLPLLILVANHAPQSTTGALFGSDTLSLVHEFTARDGVGSFSYLVGCLILANGITYLPGYVISRLFVRLRRAFRARRRRAGASGLGAVARARWLSDIESNPNASALIRDAGDAAIAQTSATDFLHGLSIEIGLISEVFEPIFEQSGLRNSTTRRWSIEAPYGHAVLAFLGAIAEQNIEPTQVNEMRPGRKVWIAATIPSSTSSWKGTLTFSLEGSAWNYQAEATADFPGQLFAWGRGSRTLSKLEHDMREYLTELAARWA